MMGAGKVPQRAAAGQALERLGQDPFALGRGLRHSHQQQKRTRIHWPGPQALQRKTLPSTAFLGKP